GLFLSLTQFETRLAQDDAPAMLQEFVQHFHKSQNMRLPLYKRKHDNPKSGFHCRMFVKIINNYLRHLAALNFYNNPYPVPVGFVSDIRDAFNSLLADKLSNFFNETGFINLVRQLCDNNAFIAACLALNQNFGTHFNQTPACGIGVNDTFSAVNNGASWEIRPLYGCHYLIDFNLGILKKHYKSVNNLAEIMRWN